MAGKSTNLAGLTILRINSENVIPSRPFQASNFNGIVTYIPLGEINQIRFHRWSDEIYLTIPLLFIKTSKIHPLIQVTLKMNKLKIHASMLKNLHPNFSPISSPSSTASSSKMSLSLRKMAHLGGAGEINQNSLLVKFQNVDSY